MAQFLGTQPGGCCVKADERQAYLVRRLEDAGGRQPHGVLHQLGERRRRLPGRAGTHGFGPLIALRAHTTVPYKTNLLGGTLRVLKRPEWARTATAAKASMCRPSPIATSHLGGPPRVPRVKPTGQGVSPIEAA